MAHSPKLAVKPAEAGRRVDVFLAERLALSRAQCRRLLARGAVRLSGSEARALSLRDKGLPLRAGEQLEVEPGAGDSERAAPEPDLPLHVLARGPGWLAVDKPAGMPVRPRSPDERGSLLGAVLARHPETHGVGEGGLRSGVVHRLDVDSSGALLVATEQDCWERLRAAFRERRVEKVYRAIALGRVEEDGRVELDLVTARHRPARVRVARPGESGARPTATSWRVVEALRGATLLELRTEGGFLHQVRATLAQLGHPLAGDASYGADAAGDATGAARHMLHASRVAFEEIEADCPDAPDFRALLDALG